MLLPGQTDHNSQAVFVRQIEDPARRNGVGAYRVRAASGNVREVTSDALEVRVGMAICIGAEWSVSNATNVQLVLASKEELAADVDAPHGLGGVYAGSLAEMQLRSYLALPVTIFLGEEDTDEDQDSLNKTPQAMAQGKTRFERGQNVFKAGKELAANRGWAFNWRLVRAPGERT